MTPALPFQTRIGHFQLPQEPCRLPFAIGSATQHHGNAVAECQNSQDAVNVIISSDRMVGVLTDGCFGTHPELEAASNSSNEVGAKLLAYIIAASADRIAAERSQLSDDAFVGKLSDRVYGAFRALLGTVCGNDPTLRKVFATDFLMATVIGLVVTDSRYLVFHSGDGVIAIDGNIKVLDDEEGRYIAKDLIASFNGHRNVIPVREHALKVYRSGDTLGLTSIFLATDGLAHFATNQAEALREFAAAQAPLRQVENGFDFLLQEFRQKIAWSPQLAPRITDDATFLMLRRKETECF